jgi:hypothetical protein
MGLTKWFLPKTDADAADNSPDGAQPGERIHITSTSMPFEWTPDFARTADDAMCLLVHAARVGKDVDDTTRKSILQAKAASNAGWDETAGTNLLAAFTKLAAELNPVTAASLRASSGDQTEPTFKSLRMWTCILAVPIILFSALAFVSSSISSSIRTDIATANELVVKLRSELGTQTAPTAGTPDKPEVPKGLNEGDVITQLQLYASTIRAIDARARQLNWFVFNAEWDPFGRYRWNSKQSDEQRQSNQQVISASFQLPVGLTNMPKALDDLTTTYQSVRSFAQSILDLVSVSYGAITTCLLPVLYALLGTCAYLLRCFEEEVRNLTFMPSSKVNWDRFLMAGIGGAVVGLFGNFTITQGASISPLAIAFLAGYAVDVFFSFLEGLLQAFTKRKSSASSATAGGSST